MTLYLATGSHPEVKAAMASGEIGQIVTPRSRNRVVPGASWAADNGVFGGHYVSDELYLRWLATYPDEQRARCLFATAPDVVGDAAATIARSASVMGGIRALGFPVAFIGQDGLTVEDTPWDEFDVFFVGGSTEWKLGAAAARLVCESVARGKRVHMGRVNSGKRIAYAEILGCHSADGSFIANGEPGGQLTRIRTVWRRVARELLAAARARGVTCARCGSDLHHDKDF